MHETYVAISYLTRIKAPATVRKTRPYGQVFITQAPYQLLFPSSLSPFPTFFLCGDLLLSLVLVHLNLYPFHFHCLYIYIYIYTYRATETVRLIILFSDLFVFILLSWSLGDLLGLCCWFALACVSLPHKETDSMLVGKMGGS